MKKFLSVYNSKDAIVDVVAVEVEADLSEYLGKEYEIRLLVWKDNLAPVTMPFER